MILAQNILLGQVWNWVTLGQKVGYPANLSEIFLTPRGQIFEVIIMNLAKNVCLDDF